MTQGEDGETFQLASGLEIYGGFAGGEDTFDDRPQPYSDKPETLTILSGDIDHDPSDTNNSDHVVTGSDTDSTAVLDGFLITKGYAVGADKPFGAGLIICGPSGLGQSCDTHPSYGDPVIQNCRFEDNKATTGGGACALQGDPTFQNCYFKGNVAESWGGAINSSGGSCIAGGASQYGDSKIIDCIFESNEVTGTGSNHGGGAICGGNSAPQIIGCSFFGNKAGQSGVDSEAVGGAIWSTTDETKTATNGTLIVNCVFSGNRSYCDGGAILADCPPDEEAPIDPNLVEVINCSFSENQAKDDDSTCHGKGGGIRKKRGDLNVKNCIFWNNFDDEHSGSSAEQAQINLDGASGTTVVSRSCIYTDGEELSDYDGNGNINGDPEFVSPAGGDDTVGTYDDNLRLSSFDDSPCIDSGDNGALPDDDLDLDEDGTAGGEKLPVDREYAPRRVDDPETTDSGAPASNAPYVDMGAYEYFIDCDTSGLPDICDVDCTASGDLCDVPGCGLSEDCNANDVPDACDPDCNTNGIPDECDITEQTSEDCNTNNMPDECERIVAARSCNTHGQAGELCLNLEIADKNIEPRINGVTIVEFDLNWSPDENQIAVDVVCVNSTYTANNGTPVVTIDGSTVRIEFTPVLPDEDACTITLESGATCGVETPYCVRTLKGDANQDGAVNTTDASQIKLRFGWAVSDATCQWDYNTDGFINTTDASQVKLVFGHSAPACQ